MTLDKAFELLELDKNCGFEGAPADLEQAHQIGIEGLQRIKDIRGYKTLMAVAVSDPGRLLPSEAAK